MVNRVDNNLQTNHVEIDQSFIQNNSDVAELVGLLIKIEIGACVLKALREIGESLREQGKHSRELQKFNEERAYEEKYEEQLSIQRKIELRRHQENYLSILPFQI